MRQALQRNSEAGVLLLAAGELQELLRVSTSSLTKVIRSSSTSTVTRIV